MEFEEVNILPVLQENWLSLPRESGSPLCPFQAHTPWAQLRGAVPAPRQHGTLSSCAFAAGPWRALWGALCRSRALSHTDRQSWPRLLTRRQSNKQVPDHQPGSLYKHQHKPFGKCTNSLKNACILSPSDPFSISPTSKNNPK